MQGLRQELRMKQELQLQPQQILRSELIQLPLLELELRVKAELEENPFLEETTELDEADSSVSETSETEQTADDNEKAKSEKTETEKDEIREVDWEDFLNDADHWEFRAKTRIQIEDSIDIPQPAVTTLNDHLYEQLHLDTFSPQEVAIGEEIIGNINRDGYLEVDLDEIAASVGVEVETVVEVHKRIIEFDPIGIASRDLRECLLIQLRHLKTGALVAEQMIDKFWKDFINKRFEVLADKLDVTLDQIKEAFEIISRLNPKPGEGYFGEKQNYVIPDLIVTQVGDEFAVYLNDGDIPNFRINPAYREMYLNKKTTEKNVREFLSRKLESARWFINAIYQRRTTMQRTMRAIVERQNGFFKRGQAYLKPMILADIAADISMDISTISRVTNGKYVQTDWGVYELKYFFSERMHTDNGTDVSNRIIKQRLEDIIEVEDKKKPYSDQVLTGLLNKEGFNIKRRTVAKYREQLRIPVKRLRREI